MRHLLIGVRMEVLRKKFQLIKITIGTFGRKPDRVIDLLGPLKDKTVVDLGAGTGYFAFRLVP